ncbi:Uncharacterised protein [Legionella jordanis]|nr:Uncharacterised protein [Legionella jordanis]
MPFNKGLNTSISISFLAIDNANPTAKFMQLFYLFEFNRKNVLFF